MNPPAIFGAIVFGSPQWGWAIAALLLLFGLVLGLAAFSAATSRGTRTTLFALKATAIVLLAACLLDPLWSRPRVRSGENIVLMLVDDSASMQMRLSRDVPESRGKWTQERLQDPNSAWQLRLTQDFDVRRYAFGAALSRVEGYQSLDFQSPASNLGNAIESLHTRFSNQPLAAILVFTDGAATDREQLDALGAQVPIFPVVTGASAPLPDSSISSVSVSQTIFEDAPITVQVQARRTDESVPLQASLEEWPEKPDGARQMMAMTTSGDRPAAARFQVKPTGVGPVFYRLRVFPEGQQDFFDHEDQSEEATLANNERLIAVNRDPRTSRILYLGGRPNWEHKFLGRALADDPKLHLVSLIRIARKEAKFDFRGRVGEDSNPLFRGFKESSDEETEAYDEPVVIRLNTRDANELSKGFPQTAPELFAYDAVILDDIEASFLTHDQQTLLDRFVSERGGGLLMLGGRDSFRHGEWQRTPVAAALPVYIDQAMPVPQGEFRWKLTREGSIETWTRVRNEEHLEQARLGDLPRLSMINSVQGVKPGARVLAEVRNDLDDAFPALVAQQYGRGRTAALLAGDLWKWSLQPDDDASQDAARTWRQMIRWLVADVPKRVTVHAEPHQGGPLPATTIQVRARNEDFQPLDNARVQVVVTQPDGSEARITAQPSVKEAGLFEAVHVSRTPGAYLARVTVSGPENLNQEPAEIGWTHQPAAAEFEQASVDIDLLGALAAKSGGELVPFERLDEFAKSLPHRKLPVMETELIPLWQRTWLLLLVIALLATEWGLRRWKGLA